MMRPTAKDRDGYTERPCYPELVAILLAGITHVAIELGFSERIAHFFSTAVCLAAVPYLVWRFRRTRGALRVWGMRSDNFRRALAAQLGLGVTGGLAIVGYGVLSGEFPLPSTFWLTLALYPIWAAAQQFALQSLIARNLEGLISRPLLLATTASLLFAVVHYPLLELVFLTFVGGIFFTLIYRRFPNLWAVALVHGLLGSLAVYLVLGEDPGAAILRFVFGG